MYPNNANYSNSVMTVFVDGEAGANAYPVGAGYTVMLIDFNSGKFWIKGTDPNGVPQRMRTFEFKEKIPQPQPPANFDGNIAISEGGTVEPISIAIALDGSAVPASQMISTPAAAEEFNAVSKNIEVDIWSGCCETITIRNTSNQAIDLENAVIEINRPDLTVTL